MRKTAERPALLRRLGVGDAALIVMGGIVGSGIFVTPSVVARIVHTPLLIMLSWIAGGAVAIIGAGVFAELAARRPHDGGVYAYLRDAYHPVVAFCYGWTLLLISQSGGAAASAVTFAFYLPAIVGIGLGAAQATAVAIVVLAFFTIVNCLGVRESTSAQNGFMIAKIVAILAVIATGLFALGRIATHPAMAAPPAGFNPLVAIGLSLVPIMFSYSGWQTSTFMAGEMRESNRSLPLGILVGVLGVIVLYLGMTAVCVFVLGPDRLAATNTPASDIVRVVAGPLGAKIMATIVALSTLGFIANQILTSPRVYFQMAADGTFFKQLAWISPRTHVPIVAIVVQGAAAILIALSGQYLLILNWVTSIDYIFFGFAALAIFIFRQRDRTAGAPEPWFRMPLHPWSTLLFLIVAWGIVGDVLVKSPTDTFLGIAVLITGIPVWYLFDRMRRWSNDRSSA
ncbi:MAG TPA: amino acid permease [Candidatus Baltobacteraceae bacterium]|nr:amino acid permease [Candidatus Baltobacteraceae bacterium]